MGDDASWAERRRALRVPVHGICVWYGGGPPVHGTIENLSETGVLVSSSSAPGATEQRMELKLGGDSGRVTARAVRIEHLARRTRVALQFDSVDERFRATISTAIQSAVASAARRPVLVVDDNLRRRREVVTELVTRGMTPLAPRTPLDTVDMLTNPHLGVTVCLLAPAFGLSRAELLTLLADAFPWVRATEITDDLELTAERAERAWSGTDMARLARALA